MSQESNSHEFAGYFHIVHQPWFKGRFTLQENWDINLKCTMRYLYFQKIFDNAKFLWGILFCRLQTLQNFLFPRCCFIPYFGSVSCFLEGTLHHSFLMTFKDWYYQSAPFNFLPLARIWTIACTFQNCIYVLVADTVLGPSLTWVDPRTGKDCERSVFFHFLLSQLSQWNEAV